MILDAGPLIAVDRNRRVFAALMAIAANNGEILRTTEAIVAQVWRSPRQANLAAALKAIDVEHEFGDGRRIGELLASAGTSDPIDAHLVVLARASGEAILTSDVDDFELLAAHRPARVVPWTG